jgi:hypothetical protein
VAETSEQRESYSYLYVLYKVKCLIQCVLQDRADSLYTWINGIGLTYWLSLACRPNIISPATVSLLIARKDPVNESNIGL